MHFCFRGKAEEGHDLAEAGAREAFRSGDGGLAFDLASVKLALQFVDDPQEPGEADVAAKE